MSSIILAGLWQCLIIPLFQSTPGDTSGVLAQDTWVMAFGQPTEITQIAPRGASFLLPATSSGNTSNYLLHSTATAIGGTLSVTVAVTADDSIVFHKDSDPANTCPTAPAAHLIFSSASGGADDNEYHRWWARTDLAGASYTLANGGTATLSMALTPANWTSVFGKHGNLNAATLAGFNDALAGAKYIGITFGGGCFYGHGVSVSGGTAKLQVLDYSVQ